MVSHRQAQHLFMPARMLALALLMSFLSVGPSWPDPGSPTTYETDSGAKALALDCTRNRLYVGFDNLFNNFYVYSLNSSNGNVNTPELTNVKYGNSTKSMALDAQRDRLYLANNDANELYVLTLDSATGNVLSSSPSNIFSSNGLALALDAQRGLLYIGLNNSTNGLGVVTLDGSGNAGAGVTYTTNSPVYALALDEARNKLYMGCDDGQLRTYTLNSGTPQILGGPYAVGSNRIVTLALDTVRNRLHVGNLSDSTLYTFALNDYLSANPGEPSGSASTFTVASPILCLTLDAMRSRLYMGVNDTGANDLHWVNMDTTTGLPLVGESSTASGDNIPAIALDAQRQRLYTTSNSNSMYFQLTDPPQTSFWINDGETTTNQAEIQLRWSVPNARFIRVSASSPLSDYYFPVTSPAKVEKDEWISADGQRWCNVVSVRANTLTVTAHLSGPDGLKTVEVWFWESAGDSNVNGVIRRETASITLDTGGFTQTPTPVVTFTPTSTFTFTPTWTPTGTPTPTPTQTSTGTPTFTSTGTPTLTPTPLPSPEDTFTFTPTHTPTPTATPTFTFTSTNTSTPTATPTFTFTSTGTETRTSTPTSTRTATPSNTPAVSPTPTCTRTATATITTTRTASPTISMTPTISPTLPPTATPTPALSFFLDKNRFTPGQEDLGIKLGMVSEADVKIIIYTLGGRQVRIWDQHLGPGYHRFVWDGRNQNQALVASGVYYVVMEWGSQRRVHKVLVIK